MLDEYKEGFKQDPVVMTRIATKIEIIKDANYKTLQEGLANEIYEGEMKGELIHAMENVIEDQFDKIDELESYTKILETKYTGDSDKKTLRQLRKESTPTSSIDEKRARSRALVNQQINKNRAITDKGNN
jgi:hypothetical protein